MLVLSFLLAPLSVPGASAATELPWAYVDGVQLVLGDTVTFGEYTIVVKDIDSISWSRAIIEVSGPEGTQEITVTENSYSYYPDVTNPVLRFSVILWNAGGTPTILLTIASPLVKVFTRAMVPGTSVTLTGDVKVTLLSVNSTSATFEAVVPTLPNPVVLSIPVDSGRGINYPLANSDYTYNNFVYLYLNATSTSSATVDFYMPKVVVTTITITPAAGTGDTVQETPTTCNCPLYDGLLYAGEGLKVKYGDTTYTVQLLSVSSTKVSVRLYRDSSLVDTYLLSLGQSQSIENTPVSFMFTTTDVDYSRATIRLYGPPETQVFPPVRQAQIRVTIDAVPKKILLEDYLVVTVDVENTGRGDSYDLKVAAPIPDGFELVSSTKSWNIKTLPALSKMPALVYVLKPTTVGKFDIGKVVVTYYDDKSLQEGRMVTVYSEPLTGIEVYSVPELSISALAYNGTWARYVTANEGETLTLSISIRASEGNPAFTYVTNATLILKYEGALDGEPLVKLGTIRAGELKNVKIPVTVTGKNMSTVSALLTYSDPLGNERTVDVGTLVTVNSIPPKVVVKQVKVWPTPDELPDYVNKTLAEMDNPQPLAKQLLTVISPYLPPGSNPWKPAGILLALLLIVLLAVLYRCRNELNAVKAKLAKRTSRPGGLPKKDDEVELLQ